MDYQVKTIHVLSVGQHVIVAQTHEDTIETFNADEQLYSFLKAGHVFHVKVAYDNRIIGLRDITLQGQTQPPAEAPTQHTPVPTPAPEVKDNHPEVIINEPYGQSEQP